MTLTQQAMTLVAATLLLAGGARAAVWHRLRSRRFGIPGIRSVSPARLPGELAPAFRAAAASLSAAGFESMGARWVGSVEVGEDARPEMAWRHASTGSFAFVRPDAAAGEPQGFSITFATRLPTGGVLATSHGPGAGALRLPPDWTLHDPGVRDPGRQWFLHRRRLAPGRGPAARGGESLESWNEFEREALAHALSAWQAEGLLRRTGRRSTGADPRWRLRAGAAWASAGTVLADRLRPGRRAVGAQAAGLDAILSAGRRQPSSISITTEGSLVGR